jgi:hypothetical protein
MMNMPTAEARSGIKSAIVDINGKSLALLRSMTSDVLAAAKLVAVQSVWNVQLCDQQRYNVWGDSN